ncbi:hypothetical protein F4780DRAFT_786540 [Xylariomycetidae sp. FL0641]|nr:hypothetical protein F4780DRAFT_786540 [Xylariomycetidae sp. FL0641]
MLPPIDEAIFEDNPNFEKLYKNITTNLLNPDGSTKSDPTAKQRDAVREELKAHRLKATRVHFLRQAIAACASNAKPASSGTEPPPQPRRTKSRPQPPAPPPSSAPLPPELQDLLLLLPPFLARAPSLPSASLVLLLTNPPFTHLQQHFAQLADLLSAALTAQASALARVLHPTTNPSYVHRLIPSLPATAGSLVAAVAQAKRALALARQSVLSQLTHAVQGACYAPLLAALLRTLEAKHGPAARSAVLRASRSALAAREWALAAEAALWTARRDVYPPPARAALANYRRHLRDAHMRLADRVRVREGELAEYGVAVAPADADADADADEGRRRGRSGTVTGGTKAAVGDENKERTMRELARVWREMEGRLKDINGDLDRLG